MLRTGIENNSKSARDMFFLGDNIVIIIIIIAFNPRTTLFFPSSVSHVTYKYYMYNGYSVYI